MDENRKTELRVSAAARRKAKLTGGKRLSTHYKVECFGKDGVLKWTDEFDNLVVTAGLNDSLDKHFKGSNYTAAWTVGLTDGTPTFAADDTMALHPGWVEVTAYDEGERQTLTLGAVAAGSVNNSASKATFTINTNATTVGGAFICMGAILYGGGAFTAGDKSLDDDDTLAVTITLTATAS